MAFNIIRKNFRCLFGLLLLLISFNASDAVDANCTFTQQLRPGQTYYITSPNYPNSYTGAHSCRWRATSNTRVKLTCSIFNISSSLLCYPDQFYVYTTPIIPIPQIYCGSGTLNLISTGNELLITFMSGLNTKGGRFSCTVEATSQMEQTCNCGYKRTSRKKRLVGAVTSGVNEYPMMAGLVDSNTSTIFCGATIIATKFVVTSARCLSSKTVSNVAILVGDQDISTGTDTAAAHVYRANGFMIHPSYNSKTNDYNIAVVSIVGTIVFSFGVGPVCLPFRHSTNTFAGSSVQLLGWGAQSFAGPTSNTLKKVKVNVIDLPICKNSSPNVTERQICTFTQGKDACQNDGGGPVLWQDTTTGRVVLVGIIGDYKCANGMPSVNTRVTSFLNWIVSVTPGTSYCLLE